MIHRSCPSLLRPLRLQTSSTRADNGCSWLDIDCSWTSALCPPPSLTSSSSLRRTDPPASCSTSSRFLHTSAQRPVSCRASA
jgi:hypothetical protein